MNIKVLDKISIRVLCVCIFIPQSFIVCKLVALAQVQVFFCAKLPLKWLWRLYVQHIYEKDCRPVLSGWLLNEQEIVFIYIFIYTSPANLSQLLPRIWKETKVSGLVHSAYLSLYKIIVANSPSTGTHVLIPYYLFYMRVNLLLLNLDALMSGTVKRQKFYEI